MSRSVPRSMFSGQKLAQLASGHQARSDARQRDTSRLRYVRHGTRGARIHFEHVHYASFGGVAHRHAWNRELNVHQPDDFQRPGQLERVVAHALQKVRGDIHGGQYAGGIPGVDAGFLDVLHDAGDDDILAIGECVDIDFDGVFQEVVNQHGTILRVLDRLFHVANDRFFVVGDDHRAPA